MFAHLVNEVSRDVACAVCTQEIQALLDEHRLVAQFRPVADFQQCVIAGYIATVRGPTGMLRGSYWGQRALADHRDALETFAHDRLRRKLCGRLRQVHCR